MRTLLMAVVKDPEALVGWSAFLATFIASVMANEQKDRLRQGTFGAIAGTTVGGLAAVLQKEPQLLLVGVFGSACGAVTGWVVYLILSFLASWKWARSLIEYHVSGLKGVRDRIDFEDRHLLISALTVWSQNYRGMVLRESQVILADPSAKDYNLWVSSALRGWLTSLVDAFNLVLDALAEKPQYRSRISLIVFGCENGKVVGRHWLSYAGARRSHTKQKFDETSVAYQVLSGGKNSPYFTTLKHANRDGQNRGERSYSSFYVFRLNEYSVLSLDWPGKIDEQDQYVDIARGLLHLDVAPAIGKLLDHWPSPLASEVKLDNWPIATQAENPPLPNRGLGGAREDTVVVGDSRSARPSDSHAEFDSL